MHEKETEILELLKILLKDNTTQKYIKWVTNDYVQYGTKYMQDQEILPESIKNYKELIQPRALKKEEERFKRTKNMAEVFTPSWVCNNQNNLIDNEWFGRKNVFNIPIKNGWVTNDDKICFSHDKTWQEYVNSRRLEVSCGEAPYLVSRYDAVTGEFIDVSNRIGLLDRKIRVVNENVDDEKNWFKWIKRAYESIYAYEYQGDSLLIARLNLFNTFLENMEYKFNHAPRLEQKKVIANIISWNIWQMDGMTMTAPYSEGEPLCKQLSLFEEVDTRKVPMFCKIFDWESNCSLEFRSLMNGD